jgi:hypothetical protein
MLNENEIIEAVARHLQNAGWSISITCSTSQCGDDIVATKGEETIFVEAKGATSSKASSRGFGQPFDSSQVRVHVAMAIHKALKRVDAGTSAIAIPGDEAHEKELHEVRGPLSRIGVRIFRVKSDGTVQEEA